MMMLNAFVSVIGMILIWKLDSHNRAGRMTGLCLGAVFAANIPLSLSLISSNVAGFTKKSTVSALMFVAYCVGNIVGPQFFIPSEKPGYPVSTPFVVCLTSLIQISNISIDWYQGRHVWFGSWNLLFDLSLRILRMGEPSPRPAVRIATGID
jgi:hypothetical protein